MPRVGESSAPGASHFGICEGAKGVLPRLALLSEAPFAVFQSRESVRGGNWCSDPTATCRASVSRTAGSSTALFVSHSEFLGSLGTFGSARTGFLQSII